ncbi:ArnT family glycosyltransferase [Brucella sp. IR073]|uniref:ArnT family glycosyltransferase n=1 Tax=unclassified Brucella TaxID=2632610 RepID=UPI003B9857FA
MVFLLVAGAALWVRPPLAIDETRYLTVAWEAYVNDHHLLLTLNGLPYTHKTPLLFAMVEEIWDVTGPNQFLARLVPVIFGAAAVLLLRVLASLLAGEDGETALSVGQPHWILAGLPMFAIFGQAFMFDTMLTCGAVIATIGTVTAAHGRMRAGLLLLILGVSLGFASKGPVILLHTVPVALLAPFWAAHELPVSRKKWTLLATAAIAAGAAINALWIVPSLVEMSKSTGWQLVWTQTFGRVEGKFGHPRPIWFFFALLPALLLPWTFSGATWSRRVWQRALKAESVRLGLVWFVSALVLHSLSAGKQAYYLLPSLPGAALALAGLVESAAAEGKDALKAPLAAGAILMGAGGILFLAGALFPAEARAILGVDTATAILPPLGLFLCGFLCWRLMRTRDPRRLAAGSAMALVALLFAQMSLSPVWQLNDPSRIVAAVPDLRERPVAWVGEYNGEIGFAAARTAPVDILDSARQAPAWLKAHPEGVVLDDAVESKAAVYGLQTRFLRWRGRYLAIMTR